MENFKKLHKSLFPPKLADKTPENRYWDKFHRSISADHLSGVTNVSFSPALPHDLIVTSSTKIEVYDPKSSAVKRSFARFKDIVYGGSFRSDGKLLVAGGEERLVRVLDANSRTVLRTFKGHEKGIRDVKFGYSNTEVISVSDDKTVRIWDVPAESELMKLEGHSDYVRCLSVPEGSEDASFGRSIFATGSYDKTVRIWDKRQNGTTSSIILPHDDPVECCLILPKKTMAITCAGPSLYVWDLLGGGGGKYMRKCTNHHKTITCIAHDKISSRIITGGLDSQLKIHNISSWEVVHSFSYNGQILCADIDPTASHLAVGLGNGVLDVRDAKRGMDRSSLPQHREPNVGSRKYFNRGTGTKPEEARAVGDEIAETTRRINLKPYEYHLKRFGYSDAVDEVVKVKDIDILHALFEELEARGSSALEIALGGRTDASLLPILSLMSSFVTNPKYSRVLISVMNCILDLYANVLSSSDELCAVLEGMSSKLKNELVTENSFLPAMGLLELFLRNANPTSASSSSSSISGE